jgi:hypothetical protein
MGYSQRLLSQERIDAGRRALSRNEKETAMNLNELSKSEQRAKIARDTEVFLAAGGKITVIRNKTIRNHRLVIPQHEAYDMGFVAGAGAKHASCNPYPKGAPDYYRWEHGFTNGVERKRRLVLMAANARAHIGLPASDQVGELDFD